MTDEPTLHDLNLLNLYYSRGNLENPRKVEEFAFWFSETYNVLDYEPHLDVLLRKSLVALSPDGHWIKITDIGVAALQSLRGRQDAWLKPGIVRVSTVEPGQILVRAGETFAGQRVIREIFASAQVSLDIVDTYVGPEMFDRIDDAEIQVPVQIVTMEKSMTASASYFRAFSKRYPRVQVRLVLGVLHDRFVIIDRSEAYHFGHSLKDLEKKDAQVNKSLHPAQLVAMFDDRWNAGKPFP